MSTRVREEPRFTLLPVRVPALSCLRQSIPSRAAYPAQRVARDNRRAQVRAPSEPDLQTHDAMRASVRLARSNAEAIVERVLSEPRSRETLPARTAAGIIGAARRNSLAALSWRGGLEHGRRGPAPGLLEFASALSSTFLILAATVSEPAPVKLSRLPQVALARTPDISDETDLIVESVATIAELLAKDAPVARLAG